MGQMQQKCLCVMNAKENTVLELRVGNIFVDIVGDLPGYVWNNIRQDMSFRPQGYTFSSSYNKTFTSDGSKKRMWDGWKRQCWKNKKRTYFPTGLYSIAIAQIRSANIPYRVVDIRNKPVQDFDIELTHSLINRDYQIRVADDACQQQRGIIQAATGAGKTAISAMIMERLKVSPFLFFVTSIDLLTQARNELQKFLLYQGTNLEVGQIGGGEINIKDVNVITVQTAYRALGYKWDSKSKFDSDDGDDLTPIEERAEDIKDLIRSAKGCICDEVQHWRATTCQLITRELKDCFYTYGMSATPYRDEGDDLMIQACFGKKVAEINATELIEKKWLMRPNIKMLHLKREKSKYSQWQKIYKDVIVEDPYYNGAMANISNAFIEQDRLVLVLVQQINHGKYLESLIPGAKFLSGSSSKSEREDSIELLRNRDIRSIVSTSIFDEGIDIKPLDTLILAGQGKSKTRAMQRIGRTLRPFENKPNPTIVDPVLHQKYLKKHGAERLKMYETEPAFNIESLYPDKIK